MHFKKNQRLLNGMLLNDIKEINRTLHLHGDAHMAQDILPQFTELVKKVEKLEGDLMPGVISGKTSLWSRVVTLERNKADASTLSGVEGDKIRQRLADHDESIEALSETVDQSTLSAKMFLERVADIEILKTQMAGLETRLSRAQDTLAEMQTDTMKHGVSPAKKPKRRGEIMKAVQK